MKLPCVLIHDLLPLYAEHLTSPETDQLLAEHLQSCPACQEELHALKLPVPVQADAHADAPLKGIRKTLQKKSIRAAAAAVLAVLCAVALVFWMGTARPRQSRPGSGPTTAKKTGPTSASWKFRVRESGWTWTASSAGANRRSQCRPCATDSQVCTKH